MTRRDRGVLLKSNIPSSNACAERFGFDISVFEIVSVVFACWSNQHNRHIGKILPPHRVLQ